MVEDKARHAGIPWLLIGCALTVLGALSADGWLLVIPGVATWAVAAYLIWYLPRKIRRGAIELARRLEPGLIAFRDGDLGRAVEIFCAVAQQFEGNKQWAGAAEQRLVAALARQGELARAIDVATDGERRASNPAVQLPAAIQLARLFTLRGDLAAAERWCVEARRRLPSGANRVPNEAALRQAELTLMVRRGDAEAPAALDTDWRSLEESLTAVSMKTLWLMRAFVAAQAGPRTSMPPFLIHKGELAWMAVEWPELRAFMDAHDL